MQVWYWCSVFIDACIVFAHHVLLLFLLMEMFKLFQEVPLLYVILVMMYLYVKCKSMYLVLLVYKTMYFCAMFENSTSKSYINLGLGIIGMYYHAMTWLYVAFCLLIKSWTWNKCGFGIGKSLSVVLAARKKSIL